MSGRCGGLMGGVQGTNGKDSKGRSWSPSVDQGEYKTMLRLPSNKFFTFLRSGGEESGEAGRGL